MNCLVISASKFPQGALAALLKDLFGSFLDLHDVSEDAVGPMQAVLAEELACIPGVLSLGLEVRESELWLSLVGAGGEVLEKRLSSGVRGESPLQRPC